MRSCHINWKSVQSLICTSPYEFVLFCKLLPAVLTTPISATDLEEGQKQKIWSEQKLRWNSCTVLLWFPATSLLLTLHDELFGKIFKVLEHCYKFVELIQMSVIGIPMHFTSYWQFSVTFSKNDRIMRTRNLTHYPKTNWKFGDLIVNHPSAVCTY